MCVSQNATFTHCFQLPLHLQVQLWLSQNTAAMVTFWIFCEGNGTPLFAQSMKKQLFTRMFSIKKNSFSKDVVPVFSNIARTLQFIFCVFSLFIDMHPFSEGGKAPFIYHIPILPLRNSSGTQRASILPSTNHHFNLTSTLWNSVIP